MSQHNHDHHHHGHNHDHDHETEGAHGGDSCGTVAYNVAGAAGSSRYRYSFVVHGLDCAEEVSALKKVVGPVAGGDEYLAFDILNGRMMVLDEANKVSAEEIRKAVKKTGMSAVEWREGDSEAKQASERHHRVQTWLTALSGIFLFAGLALHISLAGGFGAHDGQPTPLPEIIAYTLAIGFGGRFVVVKAWYAARGLRPDMNLLMVIAVSGAVGIGVWFEAAAISFLFALSLLLESWSVGRARRAIAQLLDLAPPTARVIFDSGEEKDVAAAEVAVGSRFVVNPGEKIALDGTILVGTSAVNQAPITGESMPALKEPGDDVFAGTINGEGAIEVTSTKAANDTTLARIIRLIEDAQGRRAAAEQWVEKFARSYTPAVIVMAIAVFVLPPLLFGAVWADWFYRALVLLVIACPCALVISTPVSIVSSLAAAARQGVLVKGGTYMEQPAGLKAIAFDKTGTLTRGEPAVLGIVPLNGHTEAELLARAAALETRSSHPLAQAILDRAARANIDVTPAQDVQVLPGKGVTGSFQGENFWLGSHRYLMERGQETAEIKTQAEALEREGRTVVVIGDEDHVWGLIAVADTVRPVAREVIAALRAQGVEHLIMLTGDNRATGEAIARDVGIDEVHAELLPEDKVAAVEELVRKYGSVAMVGDGVNDAPAMARASFGIAMGAMGSDAAIETADVALMTDDLTRLPWLVNHSRRTLAIIRANIVFSLGVKVIFAALAFVGFATLWGAIAADVGASLLVVANAMRLLGQGRTEDTKSPPPAAELTPAAQMAHGH